MEHTTVVYINYVKLGGSTTSLMSNMMYHPVDDHS